MSVFPGVIKLSDLNGSNGFRIDGAHDAAISGFEVSAAGDLNGDQIADFMISAPHDSMSGLRAGAVYILYGRDEKSNNNIDLGNLAVDQGFQLAGPLERAQLGVSLSHLGDINGDGFDDIIIGSSYASPDGSHYAGSAYVIFGGREGLDAKLDLFALDGATGFRIDGSNAEDRLGRTVSSAGDINGDGFDDIILGAARGGRNAYGSGETYIVFGHNGDFDPALSVGSLNGDNGFHIPGPSAVDYSGISVSGVGDINGDGFDDVIIGSYDAKPYNRFPPREGGFGTSYVIFGHAGDFDAQLDLTALNGNNGFRIKGADSFYRSTEFVSRAGDVNGDGLDDFIIGANGVDISGEQDAGVSYVVFGRSSNFGEELDLTKLDGNTGFRIDGVAAGDLSGSAVSNAGDVNRDGFDDLIVSSPSADPDAKTSAGSSYIIFGRADGFAPSFKLSDLNGENGFRIDGGSPDDRIGTSVSRAGDVNGDGVDDLIIGAPLTDPNGIDAAGSTFVIFGRATSSDGSLIGTEGNDILRGGRLPELIDGRGGNDALFGNAGDDSIIGGAGNDFLDGGRGVDQLTGGAGDDTYIVDNPNDQVIETFNAGRDRVLSSIDYKLTDNVELLVLTGTADLSGTGNALANQIQGNIGANRLDGGLGADRMTGGAGDDIYLVDNIGDAVVEQAGAGNDTVISSVGYTLRSGVENLTLDGSAIRGTGNTGDNVLTGNARANILSGGDGSDTLIGGFGADRLNGGSGADTFAFKSMNDSTNAERDLIIGFTVLGEEADKLDFSEIDTKPDVVGDQGFDFIGNAHFRNTGMAQLRVAQVGSYTLLQGDVDGNRTADFSVLLQGVLDLKIENFIL